MRKRGAIAVALLAVAAGTISAALAAGGSGSHPKRDGQARLGGHSSLPDRRELTTAAVYLGLTPAQLARDLSSGRTLAQLADATAGRSAAGLIDVLLGVRAKRLRAAISADGPSARKDAKRLARLRRRISARVEGAHHPT